MILLLQRPGAAGGTGMVECVCVGWGGGGAGGAYHNISTANVIMVREWYFNYFNYITL